MMKPLSVTTAVYAAIWANRQDGEETEDDILRRLLSCSSPSNVDQPRSEDSPQKNGEGFMDQRNGVHFAEGQRIYRRYKGKEYSAFASAGSWVREDTGRPFPSLNRLNQSIVRGQENVWNGNWFTKNNGREESIERLRN